MIRHSSMNHLKLRPVLVCLIAALFVADGLDVSVKGDLCSRHDSCSSAKHQRTCSCDGDCHLYKTCCTDAEKFPLMATTGDSYTCYSDKMHAPVFAKTSCLDNFIGNPGYIDACMDRDVDKGDIINSLLVTSLKTKITYFNKNCGICNNESIHDLEHWAIKVSCPREHNGGLFNSTYIRKKMRFNESLELWGLRVDDAFFPCNVTVHQPSAVIHHIKNCARNMVSTCPDTYDNKHTVDMCSYYHGERKLKGKDIFYKNVHCALCNGVSLKELECVGEVHSTDDSVEKEDVVNVVFTSGNWVELEMAEKFRCSRGFEYDPFQKRCRQELEKPLMSHSGNLAKSSIFTLCVVLSMMYVLTVFVKI